MTADTVNCITCLARSHLLVRQGGTRIIQVTTFKAPGEREVTHAWTSMWARLCDLTMDGAWTPE